MSSNDFSAACRASMKPERFCSGDSSILLPGPIWTRCFNEAGAFLLRRLVPLWLDSPTLSAASMKPERFCSGDPFLIGQVNPTGDRLQ